MCDKHLADRFDRLMSGDVLCDGKTSAGSGSTLVDVVQAVQQRA